MSRPRLDLDQPGALVRHDDALRALRDAAGRAYAAGASSEAVAERVLLAARDLSLGGRAERIDAAVIAAVLDREDLPE